MRRFKTSFAAWSCAAALAAFGVLYWATPHQMMVDFSTSARLAITLAAVVRFMPDAFRAFRSGRTGAEFLVVAVFSILLWMLVQAVWISLLRIYGRPDWMIESAITALIPWMLAWSIGLALVAPEMVGERVEMRPSFWRSVAIFLGGLMVGVGLTVSLAVSAPSEVLETGRAACSVNSPVWGSGHGVYHTIDSPYRDMMRPAWCFTSIEEAEAAGFRAPR